MEPVTGTQIEQAQTNKLLLSDLNWLNKAIWKLNKILCKISFQKA